MSFARYAAGCAELAVVVAALGFAAWRLRRRLLPEWTGAPARLAECVLALTLLILTGQLLGAVGLFQAAVMIPALVIAGVGIGLAAGTGLPDRTGDGAPPVRAAHPLAVAAAVLACAFIVALWSIDIQRNFDRGMYGFDTLWYHMPFSASYAQTGSVTGFHFTDPLYLNWFYPANAELVHATGILFFDRDILSPLMNLGWLGLVLLAAWCIGRPYGAGPLSVIAVVTLMGAHSLEAGQPGDAKNDIVGIALLMSAVAILVNADPGGRLRGTGDGGAARAGWALGPLVVAGLAAGLAVGTKLDVLAAVAFLTAGIVVVAPSGARRLAVLAFGLPLLAAGGFWYLRNLVSVGNPLPWIQHLGPISLPHPDRPIEGRAPFTVAHYLFDTGTYTGEAGKPSVLSEYLFSGLRKGFGRAWPLLLALGGAGMALALARGRTLLIRVLGAFALLSVVAYLFTPLSASGPEGMPVGFFLNLRYVAPALAVGLALLPLVLDIRRPVLLAGAIGLFAVLIAIGDKPGAIHRSIYTTGAVVLAVLLVLLPLLLYMLGRRGGPARALPVFVLGVTAVAFAGLGWPESRTYLSNRYTLTPYSSFNLDRAYQWARDQRNQRIGLTGTTIAYFQYGLYGTDLSNHVSYVGDRTAHGGLQPFTSCSEWRSAVNDGRYGYVVTSPFLNQNEQSQPIPSPERTWLRSDPGAELILRDQSTAVFRIVRPLDPAGCERLGKRSEITIESLKPPA